MNQLPCVIFAFDRPKLLEKTLENLREQKVDRLVVFIDGPRDSLDNENVEKCQSLAREVNWAEKELYFSEENHGLSGLTGNIDKVFKEYRWAVFIEDDCLPMPGFYPFMRKALEHYQFSDQVFSIAGYQPIKSGYFRNYSKNLVSCTRFMCWGWATWQNRWNLIFPYQKEYTNLFENLRSIPEISGADLPIIAQHMAQGKIKESWDIKVAVACMWLNMVHLIPAKGLILNSGLDRSGVHGSLSSWLRGKMFHNRNVVLALPNDLDWLDDLSINDDYMQELQKWIAKERRFSLQWHKVGLIREDLFHLKKRFEDRTHE